MESTEEPNTPKAQIAEDPRAFVVTFFKEARKLFLKEEIENHLWVSKKGVFIRTDFTDRTIEVFQGWFQQQIGDTIPYTFEKAEKKLFDEEVRKEFYLISGSSVVIGNVLECPTAELRGAGIRLYEGIPLDTASNLHHSDPIFLECEELKAQLGKAGYGAHVITRRNTFVIPFDLFPKLREFFIHSGEMRRYISAKNLRTLVQSFCRSLNYIKPLGKKQLMLLPTRIIEAKNIYLWALHSLLLVEEDGIIKDFIPLTGKAYDDLIRDELHALADNPRSRRIGGASIDLVKGSFLAHCDVSGIHHKFGVSVILSFLAELFEYAYRNHGRLVGRLRNHFTARELVSELVYLLKEAAPCMPDKIPGKIRDAFHHDSLVLVSRGEWYFSVDRTKMIRSVLYSPKVQKKEIQIIPKGS